MNLSLLSRERAVEFGRPAVGPEFGSDESLCEFLREEVHARGHAPRAATLSRIADLIAPVAEVDKEQLARLCERLEREGDFVAAPGGVLYATPVRAVALGERVRLFGSMPSKALSAALASSVEVRGTGRFAKHGSQLVENIGALGGVVLTPEQWSGIAQAPPADDHWLEGLQQRIEWIPERAGSLESDGDLDWYALTFGPNGPRWRRGGDPDAYLCRARTRYGHYRWAWTTAGHTPATHAFVSISRDEAWRASFALARRSAHPLRGLCTTAGDSCLLSLPLPLPTAEYRYLTVKAEQMDSGEYEGWRIAAELSDEVRALLQQRLGVTWDEERAAPDLTPPSPATALDEPLPVGAAMEPLFARLGVDTYRDLLPLDLNRVREMRGVGRQKYQRLKELVEEARRRRPAIEGAPEEAPPAPSIYDDWCFKEVLGRVPTRALNVLDQRGIETVRQLREWLGAVSPNDVENYGRATHRELVDLLERLDLEGHESMVFGGPAPVTVPALAKQYFERLEGRDREIFEGRFVSGRTLEELGQQHDVTRERIRQILGKHIGRDQASWGPHARSLLEPALAHIEAQGGITLTSRLFELLGNPSRGELELALTLADVTLEVDIIDGVTTNLPADTFFDLRRSLRDEIEPSLQVDSTANLVIEPLKAAGLHFTQEEFPTLVDLMLGVTLEGDRAYQNRRTMQWTYLAALLEAGGPVAAEEVARAVNEADSTAGASAHNAVVHFRRSGQAFVYEHGLWIHQDHLPVPLEVLDRLAATCLPLVEEAGGAAVSARHLLDHLKKSREAPQGLTAHLLREALLRTGKVRAWRVGTDVAWMEGVVHRRTIMDWVREVAAEFDRPFTLDEVFQEAATRSGYLVSSMYPQSYDGVLLPLTHGEYASLDKIFASPGARNKAVAEVSSLIGGRSLLSANSPLFDTDLLRPYSRKWGRGVIWGLGTLAPEVTTRARGMLMWPAAQGSTAWSALRQDLLSHEPAFSLAMMRDFMADSAGLDDDAVVYSLRHEGVLEGEILAVGMGWYVDARLSAEQQLDHLARHPDIVRMALGREAVVRASPARDLLNQLRARLGAAPVQAA